MEYRYPKIFWRPSRDFASGLLPQSHLGTAQIKGVQCQGVGESAGQGFLIAKPIDVGSAGAPISLGEDGRSLGIEAVPMIEEPVTQKTKGV
jgi:ABC-type phosphate transport system substrate-binding protein